MTKDACINCGTTEWCAKNSEYCTSCERQWHEIYHRVISCNDTPHYMQKCADGLIEKYGTYKQFTKTAL